MPTTVSNPRDLLLLELADILFVERLLAFEVLPELVTQVQLASLVHAVERHLEETHGHVARAERAFDLLDAEPSSAHSRPFAGLREQHDELAGQMKHWALAHLFHASSAARVERYEIGSYTALATLARACGHEELVELLTETVDEEVEALATLQKITERLAAEAAALETVRT